MVSFLTACVIASNDVVVTTYGPYDGSSPPNIPGKFGGSICHGSHPHHPGLPILSAACIYDTPDEVQRVLQEQIDLFRETVNSKLTQGSGNDDAERGL